MSIQHIKSVVGFPQLRIDSNSKGRITITIYNNEHSPNKAVVQYKDPNGNERQHSIQNVRDLTEQGTQIRNTQWLSLTEINECTQYLSKVTL